MGSITQFYIKLFICKSIGNHRGTLECGSAQSSCLCCQNNDFPEYCVSAANLADFHADTLEPVLYHILANKSVHPVIRLGRSSTRYLSRGWEKSKQRKNVQVAKYVDMRDIWTGIQSAKIHKQCLGNLPTM